jgi:hypothetical protein
VIILLGWKSLLEPARRGVSRQVVWPTPGSRSKSYGESRRPPWMRVIGSSEAGNSEGSTYSNQRLLGACFMDWPGKLASKMQSEPSSRSNFPAFFCINTSFASSPLLHLPTPRIPFLLARYLWQICASVLCLHPRNLSRKRWLTVILSHPHRHHLRHIC